MTAKLKALVVYMTKIRVKIQPKILEEVSINPM